MPSTRHTNFKVIWGGVINFFCKSYLYLYCGTHLGWRGGRALFFCASLLVVVLSWVVVFCFLVSFCNMGMKIDHYSPWFTSLKVNHVIHHQKAISFHYFISAGDYDKRLHALVRWIQRGQFESLKEFMKKNYR